MYGHCAHIALRESDTSDMALPSRPEVTRTGTAHRCFGPSLRVPSHGTYRRRDACIAGIAIILLEVYLTDGSSNVAGKCKLEAS